MIYTGYLIAGFSPAHFDATLVFGPPVLYADVGVQGVRRLKKRVRNEFDNLISRKVVYFLYNSGESRDFR